MNTPGGRTLPLAILGHKAQWYRTIVNISRMSWIVIHTPDRPMGFLKTAPLWRFHAACLWPSKRISLNMYWVIMKIQDQQNQFVVGQGHDTTFGFVGTTMIITKSCRILYHVCGHNRGHDTNGGLVGTTMIQHVGLWARPWYKILQDFVSRLWAQPWYRILYHARGQGHDTTCGLVGRILHDPV